MTLKEAVAELEALGNERTRLQNEKQGASDNQFGCKLGDIRKVAKKIKTDHELALALWETENVDARFLATLVVKTEELSASEMDKIVRSLKFVRVADWLNAYVVKKHPDNEKLREEWILSDDPMAARAGWNLTSIRVAKKPEGLDLSAILDCLELQMGDAAPEAQWTMNFTLVEIGINFPEFRERAISIGETLGIYRDLPAPKGCTSPFAPIWIEEMVSRQAQ